jgi:hypothetical protein
VARARVVWPHGTLSSAAGCSVHVACGFEPLLGHCKLPDSALHPTQWKKSPQPRHPDLHGVRICGGHNTRNFQPMDLGACRTTPVNLCFLGLGGVPMQTPAFLKMPQ